MRSYSKVDLIRYHNLALKHPDKGPVEMLTLYDNTYREVSEEEKLTNVKNFFKELFDEVYKEKEND